MKLGLQAAYDKHREWAWKLYTRPRFLLGGVCDEQLCGIRGLCLRQFVADWVLECLDEPRRNRVMQKVKGSAAGTVRQRRRTTASRVLPAASDVVEKVKARLNEQEAEVLQVIKVFGLDSTEVRAP